MCPSNQETFEAALSKYYTREEIDRELPQYIRAEERRRKIFRAANAVYWLAVLSVVGLAYPNIYSIPIIGGFFRSVGMIGAAILGTMMVSALLFLPAILMLLSAAKAKPLDSMTREERFRWCARLIVLTKDNGKGR